jgi:hypothetical protein
MTLKPPLPYCRPPHPPARVLPFTPTPPREPLRLTVENGPPDYTTYTAETKRKLVQPERRKATNNISTPPEHPPA